MTGWKRILGLGLLASLFFAFSLVVAASEPPQVLQISDASYSAADRVVITQALTTIEQALQQRYPIPTFRLVSRGWTERDFALFTAGRIESAGFEVLVVDGVDTEGHSATWLLAGIALVGERTAWIPVDPSQTDNPSGRFGVIAWADAAGGPFSATFMAPTSVFDMAPNRLPTASMFVVGTPVQQENASIHSTSRDSDGTLVAFVWYVGEEQVGASTSSALSYVFPASGEYLVTLTVYDNRGGSATTTEVVDVEEEAGCGCHG